MINTSTVERTITMFLFALRGCSLRCFRLFQRLVINKMKLPCKRKWKAFVCLLVACCLVIGLIQMIDRGQYCENKTMQSLAMGLDKYNANGEFDESPSLSGVIYPEVTTVPKVVYYLWCDNATFEFRHHLSVLSVIRFLRPDKIIIEYGPTPLVDRYEYNTWLAELKGDVSYLLMDQMQDRKHARVCRDEKTMRAHILSVIGTEGGIYVGKRTIFAREMRRALNENLTNQLQSSSEGFIASKGDVVIEGGAWPSKQDNCLKSSEFSSRKYNASDETTHVCAYSAIYPRDIMHGDDAFSSLARLLFYGDRAVPEPRTGVELIPNIAHMLWIGGQTIDFLFYLSALSLLHVVNVERLFVHGNGPPSGPYWQRLADHTRVTYVPCAKPNVAFGHRTGSKHHMSDIFRAPVRTSPLRPWLAYLYVGAYVAIKNKNLNIMYHLKRSMYCCEHPLYVSR